MLALPSVVRGCPERENSKRVVNLLTVERESLEPGFDSTRRLCKRPRLGAAVTRPTAGVCALSRGLCDSAHSMAPPPPGSRQQQAYDELFRRPQPAPTHRPTQPPARPPAQYPGAAPASQYAYPGPLQKPPPHGAAVSAQPYAQFGLSPQQPPLPPGHAPHALAYAQQAGAPAASSGHPLAHAHALGGGRAGQYSSQAGTVPHRGHTIANPGGGQYATLPHDRSNYAASQASSSHANLSYSRSAGAPPAPYHAAASYPQQLPPSGGSAAVSAPYSSAQAYQQQHQQQQYPPSIPGSPAPSYHSHQSQPPPASASHQHAGATWSSAHHAQGPALGSGAAEYDYGTGKLPLSPDLSRRPNSGSSTTPAVGGLSARPGYYNSSLSSGPPSASTSASLFSRTSTSSMSSLLPYASNPNPDDHHSAPSSSSGVSSLDVSPNPPAVPLPTPTARPPSGASSVYSAGSGNGTRGSSAGGGTGAGAYGHPPRLPEINPTSHDDFFGDYYQPLPAGDGVTPTASNGGGTSYWTAKRMSSGGASVASGGARSVTPTISSARQASKRYSPALRADDVEGYASIAAYGGESTRASSFRALFLPREMSAARP